MTHKLHHNWWESACSVNIVPSLISNSLLSIVKMAEAGYRAINDERRSIFMIPQPPRSQYWQTQSSKGGKAHGPNCGVSPLWTMSRMKTRTPSSFIIWDKHDCLNALYKVESTTTTWEHINTIIFQTIGREYIHNVYKSPSI
jgi:hypothetical protein